MTFDDFLALCESTTEPRGFSSHLKALWFDRQGDWDAAHEEIQDEHDRWSAAIHAYLHRKEGDISNARYWYSIANRPIFKGSLDEEWEALARELVTKGR
jgi:hypothetical protein